MSGILGLVTIGQSPRPDYESVFHRFAPRAEIRWGGALDGLDDAEIDQLVAASSAYPLHTSANGRTLEISLEVLAPLVAERARELADGGAQLVVVVCAGGFPELECPVPVLRPGALLPAVVATLTGTRRIGVVTPIPGQIEPARRKWREDGFDARVVAAAPNRHEQVRDAALALADPSLELVVLDCMGHDTDYQQEFARLSGRPVVLAQTLVARVAGEYMDGVVGAAAPLVTQSAGCSG
jgi:protein AroM